MSRSPRTYGITLSRPLKVQLRRDMHKVVGAFLIIAGLCAGLFEATGHDIPWIMESILYII